MQKGDYIRIMKELIEMLKVTKEMLEKTHQGLLEGNKDLLNNVLKLETNVNEYERRITGILIKNKADNAPFQIARDIERLGDHCEDLVQRLEIKIDEGLTFSQPAQDELNQLFNAVLEVINNTINFCEKNDKSLVRKISAARIEIDNNVKLYMTHHFERLKKGICDPRSGMVFSDLIGILGGIAKHSLLVAENWQ